MKIPPIILTWDDDATLPEPEDYVTEIATYQEHLYDRIAALSNNHQFLQKIWAFNEETRDFRERELHDPKAARVAIDHLTEMVNALFDQNAERARRSLTGYLKPYFAKQ